MTINFVYCRTDLNTKIAAFCYMSCTACAKETLSTCACAVIVLGFVVCLSFAL